MNAGLNIFAVVARGKAVGTLLTPHLHADGHYVVSMTRFERDYIRVADLADLPRWIGQGYRVRMSNQGVSSHRAPSLIAPASITVGAVSANGRGGVQVANHLRGATLTMLVISAAVGASGFLTLV